PAPFLDITGLVGSSGTEQGLLGIAFDPDYEANGRFVVNYTDRNGDTRIVSFNVSSDPDVADPQSATLILSVDQPFSNHNGGGLEFGPDGFLYIGLGDGGSGGDPGNRGQDRATLLGKLLRIDLDGGTPYAIPASNPFADSAGQKGEIWAWGLRNPWRFAFDRANGNLYIADVGQSEREEVNVAANSDGGENYGWRIMEGNSCFSATSCDRTGLTLPVLDYSHDDGCSITGGYVYRGNTVPELAGRYFYADYCGGWVRSFTFSNGQATDQREWPQLDPGGAITSFGQDAAGELYILVSGGTVYRIVPGIP
ncbi:MAG: PQQ-dependent sugar dehydrogenase, partial [Gemmatimonadales bacterium]